MKVLMIAPQPFLEPRGTPISVYQRLRGLSMLGHTVDLLTYSIGEDVHLPGVKIYRTLPIPFIKELKVGPSWPKLLLDLLLVFKALGLLLQNKYDVIHSHEEAAFIAMILAPVFRTPHLYDMHSSLPNQLRAYNFNNYRPIVNLFKILERQVLRNSEVVLTIGSDLEEHVLQIYPNANHIRIENVSVDSRVASNENPEAGLRDRLGLEEKLTVVYTGTFERYQGLDLLFKSAQFVHKIHPEVMFVMVGGKPDQIETWKGAVNRMGLKEAVLFTGTVPVNESITYLEMADILVSPRTEGLSVPLKLYSYLASGKPTVATNIFAHTQILNDKIAVIAEAEPQAFAEAILRLVENRELRKQIGQSAQAYATEEYSEKNYLKKLEIAYQSIQHSRPIKEIGKDIGQVKPAAETILELPSERIT